MTINQVNGKKHRRKKKFQMPSEEAYYAAIARINPDRPGYSEADREVMRILKECPIPYELVKKAFTGE